MIIVGNALLSEDILEKNFVCQLDKCKGACCVQGDAGAPLLHEELQIIDDVIEQVKPFMRKSALDLIDQTSFFARDPRDGELVTQCEDSGECVFVNYDDKGTAKCAIEQANSEGLIDFKKPISCHLYPIRAKKYGTHVALNYHKWEICSDACKAGDELKVPVYQFLKAPLIRKMGEEWFKELEQVAQDWENSKE
jgi:hypothetical protein